MNYSRVENRGIKILYKLFSKENLEHMSSE